MSIQRITIEALPAKVFEVLLEPRTYPSWLVGARRIRSVDAEWPEPGSAFHHVVGFGPFQIADSTRVLSAVVAQSLELDARSRPFGRARVRFTLAAVDEGRTSLTIEENPSSPVLRVLSPVLQSFIAMRNDASIKRLRDELQGRES